MTLLRSNSLNISSQEDKYVGWCAIRDLNGEYPEICIHALNRFSLEERNFYRYEILLVLVAWASKYLKQKYFLCPISINELKVHRDMFKNFNAILSEKDRKLYKEKQSKNQPYTLYFYVPRFGVSQLQSEARHMKVL